MGIGDYLIEHILLILGYIILVILKINNEVLYEHAHKKGYHVADVAECPVGDVEHGVAVQLEALDVHYEQVEDVGVDEGAEESHYDQCDYEPEHDPRLPVRRVGIEVPEVELGHAVEVDNHVHIQAIKKEAKDEVDYYAYLLLFVELLVRGVLNVERVGHEIRHYTRN